MALFVALLVPLAVLAVALGVVFGGRLGQVLVIVGAVLSGCAVLLTLTGA